MVSSSRSRSRIRRSCRRTSIARRGLRPRRRRRRRILRTHANLEARARIFKREQTFRRHGAIVRAELEIDPVHRAGLLALGDLCLETELLHGLRAFLCAILFAEEAHRNTATPVL